MLGNQDAAMAAAQEDDGISLKTQNTDTSTTAESVPEQQQQPSEQAPSSKDEFDDAMDFEDDGLDDGILASMDVDIPAQVEAPTVKKETLPGRLRLPTQVHQPKPYSLVHYR
jgi:hypothetical protein